MKCTNPLVMKNGKFAQHRWTSPSGNHFMYRFDVKEGDVYEWNTQQFRCRKCVHCIQARAKEWSIRCYLESLKHEKKCILTLTYENSPRTLVEKDVQDFLKRLRKKIGVKILYYYCGEYGTLHKRPHYHMILFGYCFDDLKFWENRNGRVYYRSNICEEIWQHGIVSIDSNPTSEGISYTVGYTAGKIYQQYDKSLSAPYQRMSRRPAIASNYADEHILKIIENGHLYVNGEKVNLPEYFMQKIKKYDVDEFERIKQMRIDSIPHTNHLYEQNKSIYQAQEKIKKALDKRSSF